MYVPRAFLLLILTIPLSSFAANRFVRAGATGNGSGTDWANAYTNLPPTLERGDTYYVAGGSYGGHVFNDNVSGTSLITIKKATLADHGTETGWQSIYGTTQAVFASGWQIYSDFYVFDGGERNSDWRLGKVDKYGFRVANTRLDNGSGKGGDNLTFRHIDFHGGGRDSGNGDDVIYGLTGNSNLIFQNCSLRDSDRTIFLMRGGWQNLTVDHSYLARNTSTPETHGEMISMTDSTNMTLSHNVIEDIEGTAFIAGINGGVASNWKIFGNIIQHTEAYESNMGRKSGHNFGVAGFVFVANDASNNNTGNNFQVYNNTFYNIQGLYSGVVIQKGSGNLVMNNIWYNSVRTNNSFPGTIGNNYYYNTPVDGDSSATKIVCSSNCNIFTNPALNDFRPLAPITAGAVLAAPFNIDPNGVTRGQDGVFDRGAFEFVAGTSTTPTTPTTPTTLSAPANLRLVSVSSSGAQIQWDYLGSGQTGFIINRKTGALGTGTQIGTSTTLSYSDSSLTASSQYCYNVVAYNATMRSSASNEFCLTTLASPVVSSASQSMLGTSTPVTLNNNDGVSYELGMKFKTLSNGKITAIRFYKSPSEKGAHTGKIYSSNGSLLSSVAFTNESASGWQQMSLATPLNVSANTVYVVSVNTGGGYYVATNKGLATQKSSANLQSIVGNNGVFGPVGSMPVSSWEDSNYFRDVVFSPDVPLMAPVNLRLVSTSSSTVQIQWDYSGSGNTGFMINRKAGTAGTYAQIGTSTTLSYSDSSLTASTPYCYNVMAYNSSSRSTSSNELCLTTKTLPESETMLGTSNPVLLNNNDGVSYELGMKFKTLTAGKITAIRFYKSPSEKGSHTGKIYSSTGTLLSSVVFTNESASGWQQMNLSAPLLVNANTVYVVSVNTGGNFYVDTVKGLATQKSSANLQSVVGNNGVFGPIGKMPSSSWEDSNYFRDVVFIRND